MEKINISRVRVESIYHVETDEEGFESLTRYSEDEWFVNYNGKELQIENPEVWEFNLQKLLLLNINTDN